MNIDNELNRSEARRRANKEQISLLWKTEAEHIVTLAQQGIDLIGISAPSGSSKSTNLKDQVLRTGFDLGYHVGHLDLQSLSLNEITKELLHEKILERAPNNTQRPGILILDEAIYIPKDNIQSVLETIKDNQYHTVIPMIRAQTEEEGLEEITPWIEAEQHIGGKTSQIHMPPKNIPLEIAREYIESNFTPPDDIKTYILANFPLRMRVLHRLGRLKTQEAVIADWSSMCDRMTKGYGFTEEEARQVNKKLGIQTELEVQAN